MQLNANICRKICKYMQLYALYAKICNPKYIQKYSFEKYAKICGKHATICIVPTSDDLMNKYAQTCKICKNMQNT